VKRVMDDSRPRGVLTEPPSGSRVGCLFMFRDDRCPCRAVPVGKSPAAHR
jgi:hypothetical protein